MSHSHGPMSDRSVAAISTPLRPAREATHLRELSPQQWKSGIAAWLGWLFDGLELHLYTLVATPLVVQLLAVPSAADPAVKEKSAYIQAAFLVGWALGGAFFGRLGDLLGRSRALALTILTYALCTGLCAFAQNWWQLMLFRFVAALGIGGEWAVGASLLAETWPRAWRPWLAAVLQTGVNLGILLGAGSAPEPPAKRNRRRASCFGARSRRRRCEQRWSVHSGSRPGGCSCSGTRNIFAGCWARKEYRPAK
jgi:hypothetical protein